MSTPIVFIDRDGTVNPELPMVRAINQFRDVAFGRTGLSANFHLRKLVRLGARLVWNSRNPDPVVRPKGRLRSMNGRRMPDPAAEHVRLLKESGIPDAWFLPGFPEVIHCSGLTKGQSVAAFCAARGIPVDSTVAFDNEIQQMVGYPPDRVIAVDSTLGITEANCNLALALLKLAPPKSVP